MGVSLAFSTGLFDPRERKECTLETCLHYCLEFLQRAKIGTWYHEMNLYVAHAKNYGRSIFAKESSRNLFILECSSNDVFPELSGVGGVAEGSKYFYGGCNDFSLPYKISSFSPDYVWVFQTNILPIILIDAGTVSRLCLKPFG